MAAGAARGRERPELAGAGAKSSSSTTTSAAHRSTGASLDRRIEKKVTAWEPAGDPNAPPGTGDWAATPSVWKRWLYYGWQPVVECNVGAATQALTASKNFTWGLDVSNVHGNASRLGLADGVGGLLGVLDIFSSARRVLRGWPTYGHVDVPGLQDIQWHVIYQKLMYFQIPCGK